jgi:hypothetical protein
MTEWYVTYAKGKWLLLRKAPDKPMTIEFSDASLEAVINAGDALTGEPLMLPLRTRADIAERTFA